MQDQSALQATQHIIDLFEKSKAQSEEALETLPGVYAVIDGDGRILKGNLKLAQLLNVGLEDVLSRGLNEIFEGENWNRFSNELDKLSSADQPAIEFQIEANDAAKSKLQYLWYVSPLKGTRPGLPRLYWVLGRDVTDLTAATQASTRMQMELNTAKLVQDTLFPEGHSAFGTSSIAGSYEPASECGGDWWHYFLKDNRIVLLIGDVTGHGVGAAIVTTAVHAVATMMGAENLSPAETLSILNRTVKATTKGKTTMTFFAASIDLKSGECVYASASHDPPFVIPEAGGKEWKSDGLKVVSSKASVPLGVEDEVSYLERRLQLKKGDRLFLYTDGIYDIANQQGVTWNRARFARNLVALASQHKDSKSLVQALKSQIAEHRSGTQLVDDVTFCVFQF